MKKKFFLLADDDRDDREMFCEALQTGDSNIICHTVENGRDVLNMLHNMEALPQLIFLDINMPVMDGWQCLEHLKQDERYKAIPVIIISTSSHQREMDIAKKLGAICYFTKPHDFNELKRVLHTIAQSHGPLLIGALQDMETYDPRYIHTLEI